jgi:hypothetical protein
MVRNVVARWIYSTIVFFGGKIKNGWTFKTVVLVLLLVYYRWDNIGDGEHSFNESIEHESFIDSRVARCELEELDPWDKSIKSYFKLTKPFDKCNKDEPLTYLNETDSTIRINQKANVTSFEGEIKRCEIATVFRNTRHDDNFSLGKYKPLNEAEEVNEDFVKVRCYAKKNPGIVYEYVHALIINKADTSKLKNEHKQHKNEFNVMVLILDGVSLSSMKRSLSKSLKYLKTFDNFYLFEKHHVVGENTFQNLVPMLTNLEYQEMLKPKKIMLRNKIQIDPPFDEFPFIWKDFKEKGYLTYFSEEWILSTFYNLKFGFKNQPTDHYLRPYWLSLYNSTSYSPTRFNSNPKPCYYNKLLHHLSFDWLRSFEKFYSDLETKESVDNIARFGIMKLNEMSHDYLERLFWIDNDLKSLLSDLFTQKFLNNTLFILMGDHGHRFHEIRTTFIGKLEEKLPMFGMMVPKRMLKDNIEIHKNLVSNTKSNN